MGNACCCCCFGYEGVAANDNGSDHHGCFQGLIIKCQTLFRRGSPVPPTSDEEAVPLDSQGMRNASSAPRLTLSTSQNPRRSQISRDDVEGQNRGSRHSSAEEPEPFTPAVQQQPKMLKEESTLFNAHKPGKSKSDSSFKVYSFVEINGVEYFIPSSEDEDVCPTCLEEYSEENPKIVTRCAHHYHLSCIYEWMERSETCPVCGKLMEFDE